MKRTRLLLILLAFCLTFATAPLIYAWAMSPAAPAPVSPAAPAALTLNEAAPLPAMADAPAGPPAPRVEMIQPAALPAQDDAPAIASRPAVDVPTIWLTPERGGASTGVRVEGAGFPPNLLLALYVSLPNAGYGPNDYLTFVSDATGAFRVAFELPATWPDGRPITQPQLIVITSTEDGRVKALAPLTYVAMIEGRGQPAVPQK